MSIGAVQSHKEWLGKEYGGLLFKISNSGDLWGTKRNGRSVFRNYFCSMSDVWICMCSELPELSGEVSLKKNLASVYRTGLAKTSHVFRHCDLSDRRSLAFAQGFWQLVVKPVNFITPHQSEVPFVGKQIFQKLGFACEPSFLSRPQPHPATLLLSFRAFRAVMILKSSSLLLERLLRRQCIRVTK